MISDRLPKNYTSSISGGGCCNFGEWSVSKDIVTVSYLDSGFLRILNNDYTCDSSKKS